MFIFVHINIVYVHKLSLCAYKLCLCYINCVHVHINYVFCNINCVCHFCASGVPQTAFHTSLQGDAAEPQGGDSPDFLLLPRLSEWAARSSVPFSTLHKGI